MNRARCCVPLCLSLSFSCRTENVADLVLYHFLYLCATYGEITSGVEHLGSVGEHATKTCSEGDTDIGIYIDLANCRSCCLAELIFGNTDSIGHLAAESVYLAYKIVGDGGSAVKNDGEVRYLLFDLFKNIKTERRGNENTFFV